MPHTPVTAYEGTEGYIFVSYAHRDMDQVLPILAALQARGYRVWYDDGIAPGSEWPENIAQHLNDCALVLAFVSDRSMESANCRREITFALAKKKPFLGIILEPTQMPLGMELQLSAQQCVMKYGYQEESRFLEKVCACPDMAPCLGHLPGAATPAEPAAPVPEAPSPAPAQPEPAAAPVKKTPAPVKSKAKAANTNPAGKKRVSPAVYAVAGVLLAVLITILATLSRPIEITPEVSVGKNETSLTLRQITVTGEVVKQLNKLEKLNYLYFRECEFAPGALNTWDGGDRLKAFSVSDSTGLDSLSFLQKESLLWDLELVNCGLTPESFDGLNLPALTNLDLSDNPEFKDTAALAGFTALRDVNLSGTGITSLAELPHDALTQLNFRDTGVEDLGCMADWGKLQVVDGSGTAVSDLSPLAGLTTLTSLSFNDCKIESVASGFQSLRITQLNLQNNGLRDVSGFENLTLLWEARLDGNALEDVSWLGKNVGELKILGLSGNALASEDLAFLSGCSKMRELYLNGIDLSASGLDFTKNMAELTRLSAISCGILDISGLSGCPNLQWIRLAKNEISDVSPLTTLTAARLTLDLAENNISDVSALPGTTYSVLSLAWNPVDWTTLSGGTYYILTANFDPAFAGGVPSDASVTYLNLLDCPADQLVAVQDCYGSGFVRDLHSTGEFIAQLAQDGLDYAPWLS